MQSYENFLKEKIKTIQDAGFDIPDLKLNAHLFPFQKYVVRLALRKGRYAIFAECGLGKTIMQLEWAHQIIKKEKKPVLIICPLAVSGQTIHEGEKFGIEVLRLGYKHKLKNTIYITNYEQLEHVEADQFVGIVLDESSILKNFTGATKRKLIKTFADTRYKLCCTATPSPNDFNELGNHSEFLNILDANDMRARWFIRDEGMNNYRLKGHAIKDFFAWISSWATMIIKPSDIGFEDNGFILPPLNYFERMIVTERKDNGKLFNDINVNATSFNQELRITLIQRFDQVADIANNSNEYFIVWVNQNEEADKAKNLIPDSVEVRGSETPAIKESKLLGFADRDFRVLITKKKIAQFGLNYQHCNNQVFASLDFSFEGLYQAIRRSYRFGQIKPVNIYLITTDTMQNVIGALKQKEDNFNLMRNYMNKAINEVKATFTMDYERREVETENYKMILGDSAIEMKNIRDNSVDLSIFSPPFSTLFTYSDNLRDLGNCENDEQFFKQNQFILKELYRIMKPGRLVCVHTKDLAMYKNSDEFTGLYDFTGEYHRAMEEAGFRYHTKITIWTDPQLEMQRTKTQRLLYKQVTKDSSFSGVGLPEYVTVFRKWDGTQDDWSPVTNLNKGNFPLETWAKWASPVWFDILRTDVLNNYRGAKDSKDEKHICPLQLSVIERLIHLWSNENEVVFSPFAGIGSEGFEALKNKRRFIGIELKESYFNTAIRNLNSILEERDQLNLLIKTA